jgi:hypothetical protein
VLAAWVQAGPGTGPGSHAGRCARAHGAARRAQFRFDLAEARSGEPSARTTVMIKNVPNKYSQKMLLEAFDRNFKRAPRRRRPAAWQRLSNRRASEAWPVGAAAAGGAEPGAAGRRAAALG